MSVRDELIEIIATTGDDDYGITADAILARFPWLAEEHRDEWEVNGYRQFERVVVRLSDTAERYAERNGGRVMHRYATPWKAQA